MYNINKIIFRKITNKATKRTNDNKFNQQVSLYLKLEY